MCGKRGKKRGHASVSEVPHVDKWGQGVMVRISLLLHALRYVWFR